MRIVQVRNIKAKGTKVLKWGESHGAIHNLNGHWQVAAVIRASQ